jgi:uncharacterized membrane protein
MSLFETLTAKAMKLAMDRAFAKGVLRCPKCGQKPATAPVDVVTLLRCQACGIDSLPQEWLLDSASVATAQPDQIPAGTRIKREGTGTSECIWHIPASGKFGFFLFFGLFWTGVTALVSAGFLFGSDREVEGSAPWVIYPVFALFWGVGLGTLYIAVRNKYARHRISVTRDLVTLRREMFGQVKEKSLVASKVTSVAQVEFYQQNYQPIYGVEIRGHEGKLRFGTTLEESEKAWLVADIKRAVFGEVHDTIAPHTPEMLAAHRQSSFSFPLPPATKGQWIGGVIFILIGLGAIAVGVFNGSDIPDQGNTAADQIAAAFDSLFSGFNLIPKIVGLVFTGIGLTMVFSTLSGSNKEVRLEGDEAQVALRTYQHGRVIKEQSFPRSSVSGVRATRSGVMNGKPVKRIDLIVDGKAQQITGWTENDTADAWASDVCRALGSM